MPASTIFEDLEDTSGSLGASPITATPTPFEGLEDRLAAAITRGQAAPDYTGLEDRLTAAALSAKPKPKSMGTTMKELGRELLAADYISFESRLPEGTQQMLGIPRKDIQDTSKAIMDSEMNPFLKVGAEVALQGGAGVYNAAGGLIKAMTSPGGVAMLVPGVATFAAGYYGLDAVIRLPDLGRKIADIIVPPPTEADFHGPGSPVSAEVLAEEQANKPEMADVIAEGLGTVLMLTGSVIGGKHALKMDRQNRAATEARRAATEAKEAAKGENAKNVTPDAPDAPPSTEGQPAPNEPMPPSGGTDVALVRPMITDVTPPVGAAPLRLNAAPILLPAAAEVAPAPSSQIAEGDAVKMAESLKTDQEPPSAADVEAARIVMQESAIKEAKNAALEEAAESAREKMVVDNQLTERLELDKVEEEMNAPDPATLGPVESGWQQVLNLKNVFYSPSQKKYQSHDGTQYIKWDGNEGAWVPDTLEPPTPEPVVAEAAPMAVAEAEAAPAFVFPSELAGAKPRYAFGANQFTLTFADDLDRATYILAQKTPSKRDADYLAAVIDQTGMTEEQARERGATVRDRIKAIARERQEGGSLEVPAITPSPKPVVEEAAPVASTPEPAATEKAPGELAKLKGEIARLENAKVVEATALQGYRRAQAANEAKGKKSEAADKRVRVTQRTYDSVVRDLEARQAKLAELEPPVEPLDILSKAYLEKLSDTELGTQLVSMQGMMIMSPKGSVYDVAYTNLKAEAERRMQSANKDAPAAKPVVAGPTEAQLAARDAYLAKYDKAIDEVNEVDLNPEATRGTVVKLARKYAKQGLIDSKVLAELERIGKDRDMGPEDVASELTGDLERARSKPPKGAEEWADGVIKKKGKQLSQNPMFDLEWMAAVLTKGLIMFRRGAMDFAAWGAEMVKELGDSVRPHLKALWDKMEKDRQKVISAMPLSKVKLLMPERDRAAVTAAEVYIRRVSKDYPESVRLKVVRDKKTGLPKVEVQKDVDGNVKVDKKTGKPVYGAVYRTVPYKLREAPGLSKLDDVAITQGADLLQAYVLEALKDPAVAKGRGWYAYMRSFLQKNFGSGQELFAQLLGASSARTPVMDNFRQSLEAIKRFSRGDYDELVQNYHEFVTNINQDAASGKLQREWVKENPDVNPKEFQLRDEVRKKINTWGEEAGRELKDLQSKGVAITNAVQESVLKKYFPLKEGGAKFNMNTMKVLQALYGNWLEQTLGPKTPNFSGNLTGRTLAATIDVWAARNLRRLLYQERVKRWRILPEQETGVGYTQDKDGVYGGDFPFAQDIYQRVSERLGIAPDDLQAITWFGEKDVWDKNGWTGSAGAEKSSFEQEAAKLDMARYQAGVTTYKDAGSYSPATQETARQRIRASIGGLRGLVASRVTHTQGLYDGIIEPSLDVEFSLLRGTDPTPVLKQLLDEGRSSGQKDVFMSQVVGADHPNARPGMEVGFKTPATQASLDEVMKVFRDNGIDGFTIARDAQDRAIGIRAQYVPEITGRYVAEHLDPLNFGVNSTDWMDRARTSNEILRRTNQNIAHATETHFSTHVFGSTEYGEKIPDDLFGRSTADELGRRQRAIEAEDRKSVSISGDRPVSGGVSPQPENPVASRPANARRTVSRKAADGLTTSERGKRNFKLLDDLGRALSTPRRGRKSSGGGPGGPAGPGGVSGGGMSSESGGISPDVAQSMAFGAAGFIHGWVANRDEDPTTRVLRAMEFGIFGLFLGSPKIRGAVAKRIYHTKLPVGKFRGTKQLAGGMDNFVVFTQSVLKGVYDAMKGESSQTAGLAYKAVGALTKLESMRKKSSPGDWFAMNRYLSGTGSLGNIVNRGLAAQVQIVRSAIDDFSLDIIGRGYAKPGSDLHFTMMFNQGAYLTRSYEIFANPDFKYDPKLQGAAVVEYIKQEVLSGSTKTIAELRQEGVELTLHQMARAKGAALGPNARSFAMGGGISRVDGSILQPRKQLSDAWKKMLGEITDPVKAATMTIDRMARFVGASITQSKMAEVGLQLGLFTERAVIKPDGSSDSIPLAMVNDAYGPSRAVIDSYIQIQRAAGSTKSFNELEQEALALNSNAETGYGPLARLYTTPEVRDALMSQYAYAQSGLIFRAIASVTGLMKIGKTVFYPISWMPNFLSAVGQVVAQGNTVRVLLNPQDSMDAISVVFDDVFPVTSKLKDDVPFLIKERILKQNVNLNDLVDTARESLIVPSASKGMRMATYVIGEKAAKLGKAVFSGALNGYGKMEEVPRVIGFYAEVNRYAYALLGKKPSQLSATEKAFVYDKAARRTREVYPNSSEVPEAIKKLSMLGALEPFVAWKYETVFRTPYNTVKAAMEDVNEGKATGNKRLISEGVKRLSWLIGVVGGSIAITEYFKKTRGVGPEQEEAIKRLLPEWDRTGALIFTELNSKEMAYANQSYLNPQSLLGAAISAAVTNKDPNEAAILFMKEVFGSMVSDGGLLWGPVTEAMTGKNQYGKPVFKKEFGRFINVNTLTDSKLGQDTALKAQQFAEKAIYAMRNLEPGFVTEGQKWIKASNDEVGPDGQLYRVSDLAKRLGGYRIQRMDIPTQYDYRAGSLAQRLRELTSDFSTLRNKRDATPAKTLTAYAQMEQGRERIWKEVSQYLKDGVTMEQDKQVMIDNLQSSGISSEFMLSVIHGFYIPAKVDDQLSIREQFNTIKAAGDLQNNPLWKQLVATDPMKAKSMISMWKGESRDKAMGVTPEDKMIMSLNDADGSRAKMIARILLQYPLEEAEVIKKGFRSRGVTRGITEQYLFGDKMNKTWAEAAATVSRPSGYDGSIPYPSERP